MRLTISLTLGLTLAVGAGCQQKSGEAPAGPGGAPRTAAPRGGPSSLPASAPAAPAAAPVGDPVKGTLKLAAGAGPVDPGDVLFIMARKSQAGAPGPLIAVKRMSGLSASSFPAAFELGPADAMMMGTPFTGPLVIYARLDRDGDPMTKTADDLYGTIEAEVAAGASDLEMTLDRRGAPAAPDAPPPAHPTSQPNR